MNMVQKTTQTNLETCYKIKRVFRNGTKRILVGLERRKWQLLSPSPRTFPQWRVSTGQSLVLQPLTPASSL